MAATMITNRDFDAISLPFPFAGILAQGESIIVALTPSQVAQYLGPLPQTGGLFLTDMPHHTGSTDFQQGGAVPGGHLGMAGDLSVGGDLNVIGTLTAGGFTPGPGDLNITGNINATLDVTAGGNVVGALDVSAGGNLIATADAVIGGDVLATGDLGGATLSVIGNGSVGGNLTVTGDLTVTGSIVGPVNRRDVGLFYGTISGNNNAQEVPYEGQSNALYVCNRPASITGISDYVVNAMSNTTIAISVYKNGAIVTGCTLNWANSADNEQVRRITFTPGTYKVNPGDVLGIRETSTNVNNNQTHYINFELTDSVVGSWAAVLDDSFQRANTAVGGAGSTTGAGNNWTDVAGNTWNIQSHELNGSTNNATGYNSNFLLRPIGENNENQRVVITFPVGEDLQEPTGAVLRYNTGNKNHYGAYIGNDALLHVYRVVGNNFVSLATAAISPVINPLHSYSLDFSAENIHSTTLTAAIVDITASAVVSTVTTTDDYVDMQAAGYYALSVWRTGGAPIAIIDRVQTYTR